MPRKKKPTPKAETPEMNLLMPDSGYPDLSHAMSALQSQIETTKNAEKISIYTKWQTQLLKIQDEIMHLQKLEKFTNNLSKKDS